MEDNQLRLKSFVTDAEHSPFPIQNLPYGVFARKNHDENCIATAIGDYVLDLTLLEQAGLLRIGPTILFNYPNLNTFAKAGADTWHAVRQRLQSLLSIENSELQNNTALLKRALIPQQDVTMKLPFKIEGFSDFYASEHHATNVGKLFRGKENALMPNWKYLPVGYNGRASTVFLSGAQIPRPKGQIKFPDQEMPIFSPSKKLDFELEMGIFIGVGNPDGKRINVNQANQHIFGLVLLNDWSARDIQAFEYQPLGPFLSKSFATSISPWVVSMAALKDVMQTIPAQHPPTVDYLQQEIRKQPNVKLKVELQTKASNKRTTLATTNYTELYWTMEQILAHHTVNNCIMKPGDLLGSGTISGPAKENWGSLLEITFNGKEPIELSDGNKRTFLEDGDTVIITGFCETDHYQIGFGSVEGTVTPALSD